MESKVIPRGNSVTCEACGNTVSPREANFYGTDEEGNDLYTCHECEQESEEDI